MVVTIPVPLQKHLSNKYILAITIVTAFSIMFLAMATVYDMGVKQGQMGALKTAYEVCKKVAPYDGEKGCQ